MLTRLKRALVGTMAALLLLLSILAALALSDHLVWPTADGTETAAKGKLTVDYSHAADGYIMARAEAGSKKYKLRIKLGKSTMTYDLNSDGEYEVFPLQLGSGKYTVTLYQNASGKKYSEEGAVSLNLQLSDENAPFLCPNQYVNYTADSRAVALSEEICAGCTTDREKLDAIKAYMLSHFNYDFIKATTVTSGTMPDMDYVLDNGMGICQDLAVLTACMLRVQGIPTKFMIGYCGKQYHAWNVVTIDGQDELYDPTMDLGGVSGSKYSVERYY